MQSETDKDERKQRRLIDTFFLPMRNPKKGHDNLSLREYFHWHRLAEAPVSDAAQVRSDTGGAPCFRCRSGAF